MAAGRDLQMTQSLQILHEFVAQATCELEVMSLKPHATTTTTCTTSKLMSFVIVQTHLPLQGVLRDSKDPDMEGV